MTPDVLRRPAAALVAVAVGYAGVGLAVGGRLGLGWDESVYVSQVARGVPAAFFSAARARGITWLVGPVAAVTTNGWALRTYLAVLAGVALAAAFWPWLRLRRGPVAPLAAVVFALLWPALYYATEAMPNLWVALPAVFATGWFLRAAEATTGRSRARGCAAVAAGAFVATVVRPTDGIWLVPPLVVASVVVPGRRRASLAGAVVGGVAAGWLPWGVEAYTRFGGLANRLRLASRIQGGTSPRLAVVTALRGVDGPLLCRPCDRPVPALGALVWIVGALAVATAVATAARYGHAAPTYVASAVGAALAVPYLFLVHYTAPRFLLPAYAVLALPAADGPLVWTRWLAAVSGRRAGLAGVAAAVALFGITQVRLATTTAGDQLPVQHGWQALTARLAADGLRPPCAVGGAQAPLLAFPAGCVARLGTGFDPDGTPPALLSQGRREPVAVVDYGTRPRPFYARHGWRRVTLVVGRRQWTAYLSPKRRTG